MSSPRNQQLDEILTVLLAINQRLGVLERWVAEWEAADMLYEEELIEHRDKTRDH